MTQQAAAAIDGLLNGIKKHGLSVTLLIAAVYWMNAKNETLSIKVDLQTTQIIDIYKAQHKTDTEQTDKLLHVIELNTKAVDNFSFYLKEKSK